MTDSRPFYRFDEPGTLHPPGAVGRLVRFALGASLLWLTYRLSVDSGLEDLRCFKDVLALHRRLRDHENQ